MKSQSGKTMLEIVLVLTLVAILAAIAIPNLAVRANRPKLEAAASSLGAIADAMRQYLLNVDTATATPNIGGNLNALIDILSGSGYLNRGDLSNDFCYAWEDNSGLPAAATMRAVMEEKGLCPTPVDLKKAVHYRVDFAGGRGNDWKRVPANASAQQNRSANADNF